MTRKAARTRTKRDDWHVMPINDLREHRMSRRCWCQPLQDVEAPSVFVHNSLDEREKFERGERKPS